MRSSFQCSLRIPYSRDKRCFFSLKAKVHVAFSSSVSRAGICRMRSTNRSHQGSQRIGYYLCDPLALGTIQDQTLCTELVKYCSHVTIVFQTIVPGTQNIYVPTVPLQLARFLCFSASVRCQTKPAPLDAQASFWGFLRGFHVRQR